MSQVSDLSRSLAPFDQNTTLTVVVELSEASWLVAGMIPGIERQPVKKQEPDPVALLRLLERWRLEAIKAGKTMAFHCVKTGDNSKLLLLWLNLCERQKLWGERPGREMMPPVLYEPEGCAP